MTLMDDPSDDDPATENIHASAAPAGNEGEKKFLSSLEPDLQSLEKIRLEKLGVYRSRRKTGIALATLLSPFTGYIDWLLLAHSTGDHGRAGLTFALIGAIWYWVSQPRRAYAKAYKQDILPQVAKRFGSFTYDAGGEIPMYEMQPSKIVPYHTSYHSEDYFAGTHNNAKIRFCEIKLEKKSGKSTVTVFRGLAILISMQKKFLSQTIVIKNAAALMQWFEEKKSGLKRADLVDPEFEKMFTVYTNDQVDARYLIDPVIIERFKSMAEIYSAQGITASYYDRQLLLLIPSHIDLFEPAALEVSAEDKRSILHMEQEMEHIFQLIDQLENYRPADSLSAAQTTQAAQG